MVAGSSSGRVAGPGLGEEQVAVLPFTWSSSPRNVYNITLYGGGRIPQMSDI